MKQGEDRGIGGGVSGLHVCPCLRETKHGVVVEQVRMRDGLIQGILLMEPQYARLEVK